MLAELIPDVLTPMSALDVLKTFRLAFILQQGKTPSNSTLAILTAQSALECGRWKAMHCFNFGNVKAGQSYVGFYTCYRCNEVIGGKVQWFDPPHPQTQFRAFKTATDGATEFLEILAKKWPEAWASALAGDTAGFVHGLKERGYFTADEAPYRVGVQSLCREFFTYLSAGLVNPDEFVPPEAPINWQLINGLRATNTDSDLAYAQGNGVHNAEQG